MKAFVALGAALVSIFVSRPLHAEERARLEYVRGPGVVGCPSEGELKSTIAARLGYEPFSDDARARILVRVTSQQKTLVGRLEIRDENGEQAGVREISSDVGDCSEVVNSLAIAVAIGMDALASARPPPSARPLPPTPAATPEDKPARAAESIEPVRLRASAGTIVSLGVAPSASLGLDAQVGVGYRSVSLGVEGRYDFPTSQTAVEGGLISASLTTGTLVPCFHQGIFAGCVLGTFGAFRSKGTSLANPSEMTDFYGAAGGRFAVEVPVSTHLLLRFHGDLLATLTRITLRLNNRNVWTSPGLAGGLGGALVASF